MAREIKVKINVDDALDLLLERVEYWTSDRDTINAFAEMYENLIDSGVFDGMEWNVMSIVDNDYNNNLTILDKSEVSKETWEMLQDIGCGEIEEVSSEDSGVIYAGQYLEVVTKNTALLRN